MGKDKTLGGILFVVCALIAIFYTATLFFPEWIGLFGLKLVDADVQFWIVAVPVFIAFVVLLGISAWIGWTMVTTSPPKSTEEVASEIEEAAEDKTG